ncbi:YegP family protein [Streptomyces sp. NPDC093600]|uniref:YegP family protein n=1 Tax=Streptomyces sp. NPDC093600 TaxID=3366047 RepID=UPI00381DB4BD
MTGSLRGKRAVVCPETDGQSIAASEHYESHRACLDGIDSVKRNADAPIQDTTGSNSGR